MDFAILSFFLSVCLCLSRGLRNLAVIAAGNAPTSLVIKSVEKLYNEE